MPAPSNSDRITGETRYRAGWFGKLILQVEEVYHVGIYGRPIAGGIERVQRTKWRDATARDLRLIDWYERTARAKAEGTCPPCPPDWGAPYSVRGGYQPSSGYSAPKKTPTSGTGGKRRAA